MGASADHAVALHHQVIHRLLEQPQIGLVFQHPSDGGFVQNTIRLCPGGSHGGAFGAVQNTELNTALVRGQRHGAAQGVHLFDQMAFANAANRRVATHLAKRFNVVRQQERFRAHARSGQRSLCASMATTDDDDIKLLGVQHKTNLWGMRGLCAASA